MAPIECATAALSEAHTERVLDSLLMPKCVNQYVAIIIDYNNKNNNGNYNEQTTANKNNNNKKIMVSKRLIGFVGNTAPSAARSGE